jgi:hypothetical protein
LHIVCAAVVLVTVFVLAGFIADAAVLAKRYWSG